MPLYEYRCRDCGRVTEVLVRSIDPKPSIVCGHCRGRNLEKMISVPAAVGVGNSARKGKTCCGREERCEAPPCSSGGSCRRD